MKMLVIWVEKANFACSMKTLIIKHILPLVASVYVYASGMCSPVAGGQIQSKDQGKHYYVTLSDGSAVPDVSFELLVSQGDKPVMRIVSKNDGEEVARFYFFNNFRAKKSSCIGYDARAKAFVIELKSRDDYRTGKDLLEMASEFLRPYAMGTLYSDVPLQYICSAGAIGEPQALDILLRVAKKSQGKLKKKLPSLKITRYDIRRDYWELEAHGDFNPFDFQLVNLKNDYIQRKAKHFGYKQSADRDSIMKRLEEGDMETVTFVSALLTIERKKR